MPSIDFRALFAGLAASTMMATSGTAHAAASVQPPYGSFGIDLTAMDTAIKPGDDFYRYVNGAWLARTTIPADKAEIGAERGLSETARARVDDLLAKAAVQGGSKIGMFYASYMNEPLIEHLGNAPVAPTIARLQRTSNRAALISLMGDLQQEGVNGLFEPYISADSGEPSVYAVYLEQSGLGLRNRHFYIDRDEPSVAGMAAYLTYATKLLSLSGQKNAAQRARAVVAFESRIAHAQWDDVQRRDEIKTYNRSTATSLASDAPGFDWARYLAALGVDPQARLIVREPSAFQEVSHLWASTPLSVLQDWLLIRYLDQNAALLSKQFFDAHFAFHGTALSGTAQPTARAVSAAKLISGEMPDGVGQAYVSAYFTPKAKTQIEAIVANVKAAFRERLATEQWMDPETRKRAITKLDAFEVVVGYPDHWRDDSGLLITPDDLVGNVARAERYTFKTMLGRLSGPVNRREFDNCAGEPWAWATPTLNEIAFAAAFLQPPFFDPDADPAVNYGAIGAVIGHELSHHFDDQGRLHDAQGKLADWWTPEDAQRFAAKAHKLVAQYDAYQPLPGLHVNGALTLGENLADLAGLNISLQAYRRSLNGRDAPIIDGFTGPQRFFISYAQSFRSKQRDADLRNQVLSDPHPPEAQRSDEVRNLDAWYDAFNVRPGDTLFLAPDQRVRIW